MFYRNNRNFIIHNKTGETFNDDVLCHYLDVVLDSKSGSTLIINSAKCPLTEKVNHTFYLKELDLKNAL